MKTHISLTIYSTALVKNAKTKPNACSLLENYQNLKIFNHLRAMEVQSWVKKLNFFKEKNSARYFRNNGQIINLMKKYLSQNRFVFYRSSDLYKKTNSIFVNYREILKKLRGVNSVLYTELTPRSFSNISRLFTNIQFLFLHKSKLWWKMHLFCERHFLIRSIVWPLFWYELSPESYDFLVSVITIKL